MAVAATRKKCCRSAQSTEAWASFNQTSCTSAVASSVCFAPHRPALPPPACEAHRRPAATTQQGSRYSPSGGCLLAVTDSIISTDLSSLPGEGPVFSERQVETRRALGRRRSWGLRQSRQADYRRGWRHLRPTLGGFTPTARKDGLRPDQHTKPTTTSLRLTHSGLPPAAQKTHPPRGQLFHFFSFREGYFARSARHFSTWSGCSRAAYSAISRSTASGSCTRPATGMFP